MEKCVNWDESGRESMEMDKDWCQKRWCGARGPKIALKCSETRFKKFKKTQKSNIWKNVVFLIAAPDLFF